MKERKALFNLMERAVREGTDRLFAFLTLRDDPFFHRLPPERHPEAVDFGLNAGAGAAETAAERYGRDPMRMAATLRITVIHSDGSAQAGTMVHFSEYREKPPEVTLYRRSMAEANQLIQEHGLEGMLGFADVEPIHLAHEIYHHLEAKRLIPGVSGFRLETFRLGPFRFRTGLPSLSEIAADRFAQRLLALKVAPKAVQLLTIYAHNPDYAWSILERLEGLRA